MKRIHVVMLMLLPAALVLTTGCASLKSAGGKAGIQLAYQMVPGKSFTIKTEGSNVITTDQMGQTVKMETVSANETRYTPSTGSPEGKTDMELEFKALSQTVNSPRGENKTDYSSWIGKKVRFSLSSKGATSDYSGFDQLPEISTATGEPLTGKIMEMSMSEIFMELPDHPLKIGESWTITKTRDIPYGSSTLKNEETIVCTLAGKEKVNGLECARITTAGTEKLTGKLQQQGMELELTRETKSSGTLLFAIEKGMYVLVDGSSTASGDIYVSAMGITVTQSITGKMKVETVFD